MYCLANRTTRELFLAQIHSPFGCHVVNEVEESVAAILDCWLWRHELWIVQENKKRIIEIECCKSDCRARSTSLWYECSQQDMGARTRAKAMSSDGKNRSDSFTKRLFHFFQLFHFLKFSQFLWDFCWLNRMSCERLFSKNLVGHLRICLAGKFLREKYVQFIAGLVLIWRERMLVCDVLAEDVVVARNCRRICTPEDSSEPIRVFIPRQIRGKHWIYQI